MRDINSLNPESIRSFIAIGLSFRVRSHINSYIERLKNTDVHVRWTKPGSIHLTLKFLGNISVDQVKDISERLSSITADLNTFDICIRSIGVFPEWRNPRVIWAGVEEGSQSVKNIASRVENNLSEIGFPEEKRDFSPHITIGRVKSMKHIDKLERVVDALKIAPVIDKVTGIELFRSQLSPKGAVYSSLFKADLQK